MAALSHSSSKRMYSWWWDSHISPKNSKWLQENLQDMDAKVKQMIKLIEEDADSFARRAEMYYKKRPELMKLVEEFYRAYRALAERYDHATGVIRQAHRTMTEAFPNQVPQVQTDDLPAGSVSSESDLQTPEMPPPPSTFFDPEESRKHTRGFPSSKFHGVKGNGAFTEESDPETGRRGLKQLNDILAVEESAIHSKFWEDRARKGLNFQDVEGKKSVFQNNGSRDIKGQVQLDSDRVMKAEAEILTLKNTICKLEAEKEAGLLQYQQSLERLSKLESEVLPEQENSHGLNERASKAEAEVQTLKGTINELENERESGLLQYQKCLEKITDLENKIFSIQKDAGELKERTTRAETEAESLKNELTKTDAEKEAALQQHKQCSQKLLDLEEKLLQAEEDVRRLSGRARETELLKLEMSRISEEKEVTAIEYQPGGETIPSLEHKLSCAEEEARRLLSEVDSCVEKLSISEERCLLLEKSNKDMQAELELLVQKVESQSEEITEKQKELDRLWTSIQDEHLRCMEAETAFQTLQNIHSQSQEMKALVVELHHKAKLLEDMEARNEILQDEIHKYKEENNVFNELKLSSALSIKNLEDEIINQRETIRKLEQEVELRVDQRNALQQEIYCLKEELNDLNKKHQAALEQVDSVGFDLPSFGCSVKKLQDENSRLKKRCEVEEVERANLLKKLEVIEKFQEKNAIHENSLSDLNVELGAFRGRVKMLEDSYQYLLEENSSLVAERATLTSQLQVTEENLKKISHQNDLLEISLLDVHAELQEMMQKSKGLEESCLVLNNEKSSLISQTETLVSQLSISHQTVEKLEKRCSASEERNLVTESEMELALEKMEQLMISLHAEREEHSKLLHSSKIQLADRDLQIHLLQEYGKCSQKEYEELLDRTVSAEIEILVLLKCVQNLEERSISLLNERQKLLGAYKMSEKLTANLENENVQKQIEINSLTERIETLRIGMNQVLIILDIKKEHLWENGIVEDHILLNHLYDQLQKTQNSFSMLFHEQQQMIIEKSVLVTVLRQLKLKVDELLTERNKLDAQIGIHTLDILVLQEENQKGLGENEELRSRIDKSDKQVEVLETELENLQQQLSDFKMAHESLHEERKSLVTKVSCICKEKSELEREFSSLVGKMLSQTTVTLIYENTLFESLAALREVLENMDKLSLINKDIDGRLEIMAKRLENLQMDNSNLQESLEKSNFELRYVESLNDHLKSEIGNEKELLLQKEIEVLQAKEMLSVLQNEKTDLQNVVEDLELKYDEARMILEDQENQMDQLSSEKEHLDGELLSLHQANQKLESEIVDLCGELRKIRVREENLSCELEKEKNEGYLWEAQAAAFYGDLQVSAAKESLFEGKIHELAEAREIVGNRISSRSTEIKLLKDRVSCLESDNGRLHEQLAAYLPAVASLKSSITSLEKQTVAKTKTNDPKNGEPQDMTKQLHAESCRAEDGDQNVTSVAALSECLTFTERISAIEKAVVDLKAIPVMKHLNGGRKEGGMKEVKELKSGSYPHQEKNQAKESWERLAAELRRSRRGPGTPEVDTEVLMKDIILDDMSECSSYGISRRDSIDPDDHMLKLWETADKDDRVPTVGKALMNDTRRAKYRNKSNNSQSAESVDEKEFSVDMLEIPQKAEEPRERKLIERFDYDTNKLADLQITIEGLKKKMEVNVRGRKGTDIQYETVMGQLEIAESTTKKLFAANRKLFKNKEEGFLTFDGKTATVSDDRGRLLEQARKVSERIGRLQLDVQRIQFLLLKLDDGKESKAKTKNPERSPKVLLRDYLYGDTARMKNQQKRKKAPIFSCVQPS